jgi:hypothetical protein
MFKRGSIASQFAIGSAYLGILTEPAHSLEYLRSRPRRMCALFQLTCRYDPLRRAPHIAALARHRRLVSLRSCKKAGSPRFSAATLSRKDAARRRRKC